MNAPARVKTPWPCAADVRALGDRFMSAGQNMRVAKKLSAEDLRNVARLLWHFTRDMKPNQMIEIPEN